MKSSAPCTMLAVLLSLSGCLGFMNDGEDKTREARWGNLTTLDKARSVAFMSKTEKDVILELNKARTNPALYAELYMRPMLARFSGREYYTPYGTFITEEGIAAVKECIEVMSAQPPLKPLSPREELARAASDHVKDTGPRGMVGHEGSDKSRRPGKSSSSSWWTTGWQAADTGGSS